MTTNFHPDWLKAPYPDFILMPTPTAFRITVTEVFDQVNIIDPDQIGKDQFKTTSAGRDVFSQTIPALDFDMTSFVLAINKRKRVRKARGKELAS